MLDYTKTRARQLVARALKSGELTKLPCEDCGDARSEAHHEDYSKPLEVNWLCRKHHSKRGFGVNGGNQCSLQINPFDDEVFAELQKLPRSQTIKQFITEAVCAKLQIPVPPQPQRGRPKDVEVVK